ncbi:hypothetical protein Hanom_Chr13g01216001 [Helianthus anomalus]
MIIFVLFNLINETFLVQSLKFLSFLFILDCLWLKSPVSLFFTRPKLKPDLYGPIIWYQSLGGSFRFSVWSDLHRKTPRDVKQLQICILMMFQI